VLTRAARAGIPQNYRILYILAAAAVAGVVVQVSGVQWLHLQAFDVVQVCAGDACWRWCEVQESAHALGAWASH
jgi:hypothetical protein